MSVTKEVLEQHLQDQGTFKEYKNGFYWVGPSTNKEKTTGQPIFRPISNRVRKEEKRRDLARRIEIHGSAKGCDLNNYESNQSVVGPVLPSPNIFVANLVPHGYLDINRDDYILSHVLEVEALLEGLGIDDVKVASIVMPPQENVRFCNVGLKCVHPAKETLFDKEDCEQQKLLPFVLGNVVEGCPSCRIEKHLNINSPNDSIKCHAMTATLSLLGSSLQSLSGCRIQPCYSFIDGTSSITALYSKLIMINNKGERASNRPEDSRNTAHVQLPPSLKYQQDYVNEALEEELMDLINDACNKGSDSPLKRRVAHFGYPFDYHAQQMDITRKLVMPPLLLELCEKLYADGLVPEIPDQVTINEYLPGQGIGFHIDVHATFTSFVATLSLGTDAIMEFRKLEELGSAIPLTPSTLRDEGKLPPAGIPQNYNKPNVLRRKLVPLQRRSVAVFSDEMRYAYQHCIPSRKSDTIDGVTKSRKTRVSITFRKIKDPRKESCPCTFDYYCDEKNTETYLNLLPTRLGGRVGSGLEKIMQAITN